MTLSISSTRLPSAYWRLWAASTISNLGDGVLIVGLPLLAARLTDDPVAISLVAVGAFLPWLLFALPVGALVDRYDRRSLMIRADGVRGLLVGLLAVLVAADQAQIWMLWIVAFGLGVGEVFFDNASNAIVPSIVPPELLEKANGRRYSAEMAANTFVGTPFGSVLFITALWLPFAVDSATFVIAAVLVLTIPGSFRAQAPAVTGCSSLTTEVRVGVRWLWANGVLRGLALSLGVFNTGVYLSQAVFVLFARKELGVSDGLFGVMLAATASGGILGGLVGERVVARYGRLASMYGPFALWAVSMLAIGVWPVAWLNVLLSSLMAFAATVWNVCTVSLRQQLVPQHLFGRVNSVYRLLTWGCIPVGSVAGGLIAQRFGLRAPYFVSAAIIAIAMVILVATVNPRSLAQAEDVASKADDLIPVLS